MKTRVLVIAGPTAVGKTELTLQLAESLHGEIISADSMQVYRGMDIGTAKASRNEQQRIKHHLLDVVDPGETFSAADYQQLARDAVDDISTRNRLPVFSGGTGLYIKAAIDEYNFIAVDNDWGLREHLKTVVREAGLSSLYRQLQSVDPKVAARVHPNDERRIIRALEVFKLTGKPLSFWEDQKDARSSVYDAIFIGLSRPREELYQRINVRVEQMFAAGLVDEVRGLAHRDLSFVARQALGYKELLPFFRGEISLETAQENIKMQTRRYAKRQLTWFRADGRYTWVDASDMTKAKEEVLAILAKLWSL